MNSSNISKYKHTLSYSIKTTRTTAPLLVAGDETDPGHRGGGHLLRQDVGPRLHHQGGLQQKLLQGLAEDHDGEGEGGDQVRQGQDI